MNRKKVYIIAAVAVILIGIAAVIFFRPTPVLKYSGSAEDYQMTITYKTFDATAHESESVILEDYDANEVLQYLSACRQRRTLLNTNSPMSDLQLIVFVTSAVGDAPVLSVCGDGKSYCTDNGGKKLLLNDDEVLKELKQLLNIADTQ